MTERKFTDKDIIKCLRHCNGGDCETCKALGVCDATWKFHQDALDLINRQRAEIERLNASIKEADKYFSEGDFANGIALIIRLVKEMG